MNLDVVLTLEGMLIIGLVIAAIGTASAQLFRNANTPYLITITGTRTELIVLGASLWVVAVGAGIASLLIASAFTTGVIGLAIFFGVESVALDICANRTRYIRASSTSSRPVRIYASRSQHS